jgi:hypothetical protein
VDIRSVTITRMIKVGTQPKLTVEFRAKPARNKLLGWLLRNRDTASSTKAHEKAIERPGSRSIAYLLHLPLRRPWILKS